MNAADGGLSPFVLNGPTDIPRRASVTSAQGPAAVGQSMKSPYLSGRVPKIPVAWARLCLSPREVAPTDCRRGNASPLPLPSRERRLMRNRKPKGRPELCADCPTPHPPFGHLLPQGEKAVIERFAVGTPSPLEGEGSAARSVSDVAERGEGSGSRHRASPRSEGGRYLSSSETSANSSGRAVVYLIWPMAKEELTSVRLMREISFL